MPERHPTAAIPPKRLAGQCATATNHEAAMVGKIRAAASQIDPRQELACSPRPSEDPRTDGTADILAISLPHLKRDAALEIRIQSEPPARTFQVQPGNTVAARAKRRIVPVRSRSRLSCGAHRPALLDRQAETESSPCAEPPMHTSLDRVQQHVITVILPRFL
jgi:hypothetical protein